MSVLGLRIVLLGLLSVFWELLSFMHSLKRALMLIGWSLSSSLSAGLTRNGSDEKEGFQILSIDLNAFNTLEIGVQKLRVWLEEKTFCADLMSAIAWNQHHEVFSPDPNYHERFTHFPSLLPKSQQIYQFSEVWPFSYLWLATNSFISFIKAGSFIRAHRCEKRKVYETEWNFCTVIPVSVCTPTDFFWAERYNKLPHRELFEGLFDTGKMCSTIFYFGSVRKVQTQRVHWGVPVFIQQKYMQNKIKATTAVP